MEQGIGQILDLDLLQIDFKRLSDAEIEEKGRKYYSDLFLQNARFGIHALHDGEQIYFARGRFKHAFFMAENWQESERKTSIDIRRVERIQWILPVIQGKIPNTECWLVTEDGVEKRIYLCFGKGFVIWLEGSDEGKWTFSTAYTASGSQIRGYIRGGKLIWKYGKKNCS